MEVAAPATLYGMAIAEPPQLNRKHDGTCMFIVELIRVYAMLLINYFVIALFTLQIYKMNEETELQCSSKFAVLEFMCVFVFEVRMLIDLQESFSIMSLLYFAPAPKVALGSESQYAASREASGRGFFNNYTQARDASPVAGGILAAEDEMKKGWFGRKRVMKGDAPSWQMSGLSRCFRVFSFLFVALPKLFFAVAVAYIGGIFILKSPDAGTMVMNTLAVVFLAEIDEILYTAFTSEALRWQLENMDAVEMHLSNMKRLGMWLLSSVFFPLLTIAATAFIQSHTKQVECEEFEWKMPRLASAVHDLFQ